MDAHFGNEGPSMYDVFSNPPWYRVVAIVIAACCVAVTWVLSCQHYCTLRRSLEQAMGRRPPEQQELLRLRLRDRQRLLLRIVFMVPMFSIAFFVPLLAPRTKFIWELVRGVAEARALESFLLALVDLLGGEERANHALSLLEPQRFLAVPPLGCCWLCCPCVPLPCCAARRWSPGVMRIAMCAARQYKYTVPAVAVGILFTQVNVLSLHADGSHGAERVAAIMQGSALLVRVLEKVQQIAMLVCIYALMVLFNATRELLRHLKPGSMFATIKVPLVVSVLQEQLLLHLARHSVIAGDGTLRASERAIALHYLLGVVWTLLVALQISRAFPASLLTAQGNSDHVAAMESFLSSNSYADVEMTGPCHALEPLPENGVAGDAASNGTAQRS